LKKSEIIFFFDSLKQSTPAPRTELSFENHFQLLTAVILSAQATDISVNKATTPLFKVAPTAEKMIALGKENLIQHIKSIGLYNAKAKNIILMSQILIDKYDGEVPSSFSALEQLPGVGRKTANVVLNEAFQIPTVAVDTHVFRVSNRTGLALGKTPHEVEAKLVKRIPKEYLLHAHHWLILHGRYICVARKPKCTQCSVSSVCKLYRKISVDFVKSNNAKCNNDK